MENYVPTKEINPNAMKYKPKSKLIKWPEEVKVRINASELMVISKAKDLVSYVFVISKNTPKKFRQTFVNRLQNYGLDCIENLYKANEIMLSKTKPENYEKRLTFQNNATTSLRLLEYFALLAYENECILLKQYSQIVKLGSECAIMIANWIKSDKSRMV